MLCCDLSLYWFLSILSWGNGVRDVLGRIYEIGRVEDAYFLECSEGVVDFN